MTARRGLGSARPADGSQACGTPRSRLPPALQGVGPERGSLLSGPGGLGREAAQWLIAQSMMLIPSPYACGENV